MGCRMAPAKPSNRPSNRRSLFERKNNALLRKRGKFGVDIRYSVHTVEGGTSEGFRLAISRHVESPSFFALNGDQITDLRLDKIYKNYRETECLASVAVVHPRLPFGLVEINNRGFCQGFVEKPVLNNVFIS